MAVQDAVTRLSDASRWIYLEKLGRYWSERDKDKKEGEKFNFNPKIEELSQTFRDLRFNILPIISRVRDEKVRNAAVQLYFLDLDMVLLELTTWQGKIYGCDDPVQIQEMLLPKFIRMAGILLRGQSIDDESFPKNLHATGVRGSEEWFQTSPDE